MKHETHIGNKLNKKIKQVKLHKEERHIIGGNGASYSSCYLAILDCPEEIVVEIDSYVKKLHPDWDKHTDNRAAVLTTELKGRDLECEIIEFCPPKSYEGKLIRII